MRHFLGQEHGLPFVLRGDIVLPGGCERLTYKRNRFDALDIVKMLDNPHDQFFAYLIPEGGYNADLEQVTSVSVLVELQGIAVTDDEVELSVSGHARYVIKHCVPTANQLYATEISPIKDTTTKFEEIVELEQDILKEFDARGEDYEEFSRALRIIKDHSYYADYVLFGYYESQEDFVRILNTLSILKRMREAYMCVNPEDKTTAIEDGIKGNATETPKIKSNNEEVKPLIAKYYEIEGLLNDKAKKEIFATLKSLATMSTQAADYSAYMKYIELAVNLPFTERTIDNDITHVETEIEKTHYGMKKAKERLMEYLAIRQLNPEAKGTVILLDGPAGTGKTTLAQSMAKAMGRKCERISMGGCNDASFIKGHSRTYTGSRHGRLIAAMSATGVKNPIIILDEIEKVTTGNGGDPEGAMLELLDPNQNSTFTDTYLGFGFDMSEVLFICTSNDADRIYPALLDRMELISIDGYNRTEKLSIAEKYVMPKKSKDLGIPGETISRPVLNHIINGYTFEAGIRGLEKAIDNLFRKVAVDAAKGKYTKVTKTLVTKRLGQPYEEEKPMEHRIPGLVTGLYYSTDGGGCLDLEGIITDKDGNGGCAMTGQTGDVMNESLGLVHSHMMANQRRYDCSKFDLKEIDIHVHIPSGSTPKDGPSAGAAFSLLLASIAKDKPVRPGLAMTGECTLTGRITAIGGVDQKCAGAVRMGMTDIILPEANRRDYEELPKNVKKSARYHFVKTVEEVIEIGLNY